MRCLRRKERKFQIIHIKTANEEQTRDKNQIEQIRQQFCKDLYDSKIEKSLEYTNKKVMNGDSEDTADIIDYIL